jgi:ABC-type branched-subunit amino acid transport system substrate-binding protein
VLKANGAEMVGALIYEKDKPTYRTEVDQAMRAKPDALYLNGYAPDVTIVVRDLFRAGYDGLRFTQSYAMTSKVLEGLPPEVTEGIHTVQPSADIASPAFELAKKRLGNEPDSYEAQATDWISIVALGIAKAGEPRGEGIRNVSRRITQGSGEKVYSAVDGLRLIKEGKEINYEGVSGPCDFNDIGDILDCKFRYQQVEKGQLKFLKVV